VTRSSRSHGMGWRGAGVRKGKGVKGRKGRGEGKATKEIREFARSVITDAKHRDRFGFVSPPRCAPQGEIQAEDQRDQLSALGERLFELHPPF